MPVLALAYTVDQIHKIISPNVPFSSNQNRKRPAPGAKPKVKRLRVQPSQLLQQPTAKLAPSSRQQPVQSVFEQAVGIPQHSTKIGVKLADSISAIFEAGPQQMVPLPEEKQVTGERLKLFCLSM